MNNNNTTSEGYLVFADYEQFSDWAYDPQSKNEDGTWARLKRKDLILILDENIFYKGVMQVLHSHEEG
jgi:hypothetical protein